MFPSWRPFVFLCCLDAPAENFILYLKFEVLAAMTMKSTISYDVTPYSQVEVYRSV
jgi:hypothetical protein